MHRAALLALLALAPLGLAPGGQAACDPAGQVCWDEATSGHCSTEGSGWSDVKARNVMLGFPLVAEAHGQYVCAGKAFTRDVWTNASAGTTAGVFVHWQTQDAGWRLIQVRTVGPLLATSTTWYGSAGSGTCNLETTAAVAGGFASDRRTCPVQALPPQQPDVKWGNVLP